MPHKSGEKISRLKAGPSHGIGFSRVFEFHDFTMEKVSTDLSFIKEINRS